ncbi:addiction module antidote protein, HigA family [candidate division TA06 bacterium]|uniref:Addiction module antidote protein, HigA family n=1 Tax=candidate division TA06 bacterium TaxID=2250710 RepID=A0A523UQZ1_UNCT6|nr:MAG: addiction module antidote protein, HigA family [candidate division TA06 bacterium]
MAGTIVDQFDPDYAVHPGEILEETLEARGMKKTSFAVRCGLSAKTVSQIISGKAPVTPETAIQFERVLGVSAAVWSNLNTFYDLHMARVSARKRLEKQVRWAKSFPLTELVRRGIIEKPTNAVDAVEKLLNFLGVGSVDAWQERQQQLVEASVAYRHSPSFESAPESVAVWLRVGIIRAARIDARPYSKAKFKSALEEIRTVTSQPAKVFGPKMKELCRQAGVALVFVSEFPGTHLSGATCWLNKDKALILLSLRHKRDDHLWFSFYHEAAHVLLHGKKKVFLDETKRMQGGMESKADSFAANALIPERDYLAFVSQERFSKNSIMIFAKRIGIAPGIVVGRLQHDGKIPHWWHNDLKRGLRLVETTE